MSKFETDQIYDSTKGEFSDGCASWWMHIRRVDNGYYIVCSDNSQLVIEEKEDDPLAEHEQLLYDVRDFFGFRGSKHDKERIVIKRVRGNDD